MATSLSTNQPKRGEVWLVSFDPNLGAEIKKTRPGVIISSDYVGRLPIKLVAPLTDWKEHFATNLWHIKVTPDAENGLSKPSAVDVLQTRGLDIQRFVRRLGKISDASLEEIVLAVSDIIECP